MRYIWINHGNVDFATMPFRNSYKDWAGVWEYPVDRFNILEGKLELPHKNIVRDPVYNLTNLTTNWKDRYFSLMNQVADNVYTTAGTRTINLFFSGGVDSTAVYVALAKHPKFKEFTEQGRFKVSLTSSSIQEYSKLFFDDILPKVILQPLDYDKSLNNPNELMVTGDFGDFIIGNADASMFPGVDLMGGPWEVLREIKNRNLKEYEEMCIKAIRSAPFTIYSINQLLWWVNQCYVYQIELLRPYIWSSTTDYRDVSTNNKVFRFFYDDLITAFSYEYMSTNPVLRDYESLRKLPKDYIFDYTKDSDYILKPKVYSQRLTHRILYKTCIFEQDNIIQETSTPEKFLC
jgi:hypothetical protein